MTPLERLARSIIAQALVDAGIAPADGKKNGARRNADQNERDEAIRFLTAEGGPWARSRADWCSLADRDPEQLRQFATARLAPPETQAPPPREPRPGTKGRIAWDLACRPEGVSADELAAMFGWARGSVQVLMTSDFETKYGRRAVRGKDGRYRLAVP